MAHASSPESPDWQDEVATEQAEAEAEAEGRSERVRRRNREKKRRWKRSQRGKRDNKAMAAAAERAELLDGVMQLLAESEEEEEEVAAEVAVVRLQESEHKQDLQKVIAWFQSRKTDIKHQLEWEIDLNKSFPQYIDFFNRQLQDNESKLIEANGTIAVLEGKVSQLQGDFLDQEMQLQSVVSQKVELIGQRDAICRLLEKERKKQQEELLAVQNQLLEERERHEAVARPLRSGLQQFTRGQRK